MNKWWKMGLLGAAALGATALTGGAAAPMLSGLLGGEGAAAAGAAGAAESGALGVGAAGAAAPGAMAFTTPSIMGAASPGLSGMLAGTTAEYGTPAMLAEASANAAAAPTPGMLAQMGGYAKDAGKALSTYNSVSGAMGGGQGAAPLPPQGQPVFQGAATPITPQGPSGPMMGAQDTPFMRLLMDQKMKQRGMLG